MDDRRQRQAGEVTSARRASARLFAFDKRRPVLLYRCGVCLFVVLAAACTSHPRTSASSDSDEIQVGLPEGNANGGDFGAAQFANLLSFESLTNNGTDGRAIPRLAQSWQWESNGRRLRVFLRNDVMLHDGRRFEGETAAEIVRAAITWPRNLAGYAALTDVERVTAPEKLQLVFDLKRPSALLPEDLTVPLDVGKNPVGTGPYRVTQRNQSETVLERFDQYYLGLPAIARVRVHSFDAIRTAWTSLLRGQVDLVYDVPADALEFVTNNDVKVLRVERWYQYVIAFNSARGALRLPAVRRALNMAVDRDALLREVLGGRGKPSSGPVWPDYWAHDSTVPSFAYDPTQAEAILDAAGFRLQPSNNPRQPPARLRFTCLIPDNFAVYERIALEVQRTLYNIGVDMQFSVVSPNEFNSRMISGAFDAAFVDMISGPTPGRTYMFWHSAKAEKGGYNIFGYEDEAAEQAFETLRTNTSEAATRSATRRLQRIFVDDPPALFLAWNERSRAVRAEFEIPPAEGRDPVWWLWRWTRRAGPPINTTE